MGFIGRLETCFAAHHHFLAIKICSSFHGNTRSFLKVFGGMHSLCVVFCAHISRRWAEPLCALVKLSFLILKQIPSSFFVHVFCSKISENPTFSWYLKWNICTYNVYPHVKKEHLWCPLSKKYMLDNNGHQKADPKQGLSCVTKKCCCSTIVENWSRERKWGANHLASSHCTISRKCPC